tara:strand:+ start:162 stop:521 length:360 start_codon:yes stop_codon:yes gene_type:complete
MHTHTTLFSLTRAERRIVIETSEILVTSLAEGLPRIDFHPTLIIKSLDPKAVEGLIFDFNVELQTIIHDNADHVFKLGDVDARIFLDTLKFLAPLYQKYAPNAFSSLIQKLKIGHTIGN